MPAPIIAASCLSCARRETALRTLAVGCLLLLGGCGPNFGWHVVDPRLPAGASNLTFILEGFSATILVSLSAMALSIAILLGAGSVVGWRAHAPAWQIAEAVLLLLVFASAMIWLGTLLGMLVRAPDAVMGVAFVVVFPLTFMSNAFVPIESLPNTLQWFASINPVSVLVAAVRHLFGNPISPVTKDVWTMQHPVAAAWIVCAVLLAVSVPAALRRYRRRTVD